MKGSKACQQTTKKLKATGKCKDICFCLWSGRSGFNPHSGSYCISDWQWIFRFSSEQNWTSSHLLQFINGSLSIGQKTQHFWFILRLPPAPNWKEGLLETLGTFRNSRKQEKHAMYLSHRSATPLCQSWAALLESYWREPRTALKMVLNDVRRRAQLDQSRGFTPCLSYNKKKADGWTNHIFIFYHRNLNLQFNILALEMAALQSLSTYLNAILGSIVGMHDSSWLLSLLFPMRERALETI